MAEKNLIGELDMYREAGIKPNFSDIAKRYGKDRHTVAAYWRAEGGRPRDGRADRWIGNTYLDVSGRDSPASLNSTGDM